MWLQAQAPGLPPNRPNSKRASRARRLPAPPTFAQPSPGPGPSLIPPPRASRLQRSAWRRWAAWRLRPLCTTGSTCRAPSSSFGSSTSPPSVSASVGAPKKMRGGAGTPARGPASGSCLEGRLDWRVRCSSRRRLLITGVAAAHAPLRPSLCHVQPWRTPSPRSRPAWTLPTR
jgi:hypothetical protein